MSQDKLYVGALAPQALVAKVVPGSTGLDITAIAGASISVKKPSGTIVSWAATKSTGSNFPGVPASTAAASYWVHPYESGDIDEDGIYVSWADQLQPSDEFGQADEASFFVSKR